MFDKLCKVSSNISTIVEDVCKHVWEEHRTALFTTVVLVSAVKIHHVVKNRKLRQKWNSVGENVVVLHGFGRATTCPNLSPFIAKLETYLRMAGIKYEYDTEQPIGRKGKSPWITLNGEDYTDSQLIMEDLGKKFNKNFSSNFSPEQKSVARAMLIMNDEHLFWGLVWWRIVKDPDERIWDLMKFPRGLCLSPRVFRHRIRKQLWVQGTGRHSDEEIEEMSRKDIEALSLYLGEKRFLMGDTPSEVDCAVFGLISQFVWGTPGSPFAAMVQSDYRNLLHYCIRMKEKYWPDWEKLLIE